ncbi:MFS transporter [Sphingomonas taxi]|uniref:MFS transporter n=1 Tax=Sphingomonas taxi TaxID=1549858 RepID=UPI0024805512|nr:MFS transporter [Sphingomonas taxi]
MHARSPSFSPWRGPFLKVWLLRACSTLGGQVLAFAVTLRLYEASGSALDLGLVGLVQFLPGFALAIPAGQLVDRFAPARVAIGVQSVNALAAAMLLVPGLSKDGLTALLFAAALATGATRAFDHPVNTALLPSVVPDRHVARAVAWTTSIAKMGTLAGPILGGMLYALSPAADYAVACGLFLLGIVAAGTIPAIVRSATAPALDLRAAFAGFSIIRRDRVLGGAMLLDMVAVLLGGATALLPVFAKDVLHVGAAELGILRAAPAVGAVLTGLWLARHPVERHAGRVLVATTLLFGALTCGFGLTQSLVPACALLCGIGAADMISIHIRSALVQLRTPPELRGRVGAVNGLFISSSNQIGAFESGVTAYWFGLVPAILLGGGATIAATAAIARLFAPLRRVDRLADTPAPPARPRQRQPV